MALLSPLLEHLLRRAGFGATPAERASFEGLDYYEAVSRLVDYDPAKTDIDAKLGTPGYVGITTRGQFELFRDQALGKFRDLLMEVAKDPAMLVWLDGRTNTKAKPQENFGRELMELFTFGVENYVETDVYAAARVFTGWNLATRGV